MSKLAHHHSMTTVSRIQDWIGKIAVAAAVIGGVIVLASALTSHGNVTW